MLLMALQDRVMRFLLTMRKRQPKARGVLLVSARGPAEMVFLAAVLPRFLRLAEPGEAVTLLMRSDAGAMNFLFPRALALKKVDFYRLVRQRPYRWKIFQELFAAHYRLVVSLDTQRDPVLDEALIGAAMAPAMVGMATGTTPPPPRFPFTRLYPTGPARQDKIVRWSVFCDLLTEFRHPLAMALMSDHQLPDPARFESPTIIIFPFSGVARRQSQPELWRLILGLLPPFWHIRIAGHKNDFDANPQFSELLRIKNVSVETAGFDHLASLLLGARMVIGVDTAGVHLANLLGVPTLCLASAAYVGAGVPYDPRISPANAHFLYTPMDCQGCMGHCRFPPVGGMFPCVEALESDQVMGAVRDMVARGGY